MLVYFLQILDHFSENEKVNTDNRIATKWTELAFFREAPILVDSASDD